VLLDKAMMADIEQAERSHLERTNEAMDAMQKAHRSKVKQLIKTDLEGQMEFREARTKHFVDQHPRQKVPFDVKHLPGTDETKAGHPPIRPPATLSAAVQACPPRHEQ